MERFDVIVIGAGAAGLMAAGAAAQRGRRVLVLEHGREVGAKILISGGGRCNFTNREIKPERFLSENPHFARSALTRYTAGDFVALVERHGVAYYEKTLGQLFCEGVGAAKRIVALLMAEAAAAEVRTGATVSAVEHGLDGFTVRLHGGIARADAVIVATGGLSIPKLGATDFAYRIARQFGLRLVETAPALVPLTFSEEDRAWMAPLSGASIDAVARCGKAAFREGMLFTHRGLSGPAILQISSYWRPGQPIALDLAPGYDLAAALLARKRERPKAELKTILAERLPARLAEHLAAGDPRPMTDFKDDALRALAARLHTFALTPTGDEGYAKAEVTRGGIDTRDLDQKTMMARAVPGLAFVGECVDVTGWLGGYNFQWAWSSGWAAGMAA